MCVYVTLSNVYCVCVCVCAGVSADVEELLVEGLLLQVTLPELQQLLLILQTRLCSSPSANHTSSSHCDHLYYASLEKSPPHSNTQVRPSL